VAETSFHTFGLNENFNFGFVFWRKKKISILWYIKKLENGQSLIPQVFILFLLYI